MRIRQLSEETQPFEDKKVDPALMTFDEYYALVNPNNKFHPSNAYDMDQKKINEIYKKADFNIPVRAIRVNNLRFEIWLKKEDRFQDGHFVKHDPDGEILRDEKGMAIYFTPEELMRSDRQRWDYSFGVFHGDQMVAYTADEWGCMLVVVAKEFRGWGFGPIILKMAREIEPGKTSGGFTSAGRYNIMKVYRQFVDDYLRTGMYSFLVRSGQLKADRAKAIIQSAQAAYQKPKVAPAQQYNLNSNNPSDWLLYVGEAGDFILYDRKLKDLLDKGVIDSDEFRHWVDEMIIGAVYASGRNYNHVHQFGAKSEQIKMFMMRLALTEVSRHGETLVFTEELRPYVTQRGVEIINQNEARLVSDPIAYEAMTQAERQFRKSFDRHDEFRYRLLELAYGKYQITR